MNNAEIVKSLKNSTALTFYAREIKELAEAFEGGDFDAACQIADTLADEIEASQDGEECDDTLALRDLAANL